jgi:CopA family copper-resistance protein
MTHSFDRSRRRFVQGLAGTAVAASGLLPLRFGSRASAAAGPAGVLTGPEVHLEIGQREVSITGAKRFATVVNGRLPGPVLRWREGDPITVHVTNRLTAPTSIHWHGVIVPADMDGVPGVSFKGIEPGSTFTYRFRVNQSGTYWYHSHSRFQEQVGLYGALIVEPRAGERQRASREHVVLLSDWTDQDPEHLYRTLKLHSDYYNFGKRTAGDFLADLRSRGWSETLADRRMWGEMRMSPTDLSDVSGYAYTYLMNGVPPAGNWTGLFEPGETVRLRCINGSSMTFFDLRIPGLKLTVIAADGQDVEPVAVDEVRIGPAEVYDLLVEPDEARAYALFAQALDRSGYALGTLAPRQGLRATAPALDSRALLTMADMGQAMGHDMPAGHDMSSMGAMTMPTMDRLGDPGVGLRNNGRRVLTYADLHTVGGPLDSREPSREIELHLTGHMSRFIWSFDDKKFSDSEPLRFHYGERLTLVLINDSMMLHPIHLHGMWGEIYSADGRFQVRKHTITVQPGQRLTYRVTADALGTWAYHCHLLYHMEAGMFREVVVAPGAAS